MGKRGTAAAVIALAVLGTSCSRMDVPIEEPVAVLVEEEEEIVVPTDAPASVPTEIPEPTPIPLDAIFSSSFGLERYETFHARLLEAGLTAEEPAILVDYIAAADALLSLESHGAVLDFVFGNLIRADSLEELSSRVDVLAAERGEEIAADYLDEVFSSLGEDSAKVIVHGMPWQYNDGSLIVTSFTGMFIDVELARMTGYSSENIHVFALNAQTEAIAEQVAVYDANLLANMYPLNWMLVDAEQWVVSHPEQVVSDASKEGALEALSGILAEHDAVYLSMTMHGSSKYFLLAHPEDGNKKVSHAEFADLLVDAALQHEGDSSYVVDLCQCGGSAVGQNIAKQLSSRYADISDEEKPDITLRLCSVHDNYPYRVNIFDRVLVQYVQALQNGGLVLDDWDTHNTADSLVYDAGDDSFTYPLWQGTHPNYPDMDLEVRAYRVSSEGALEEISADILEPFVLTSYSAQN